jgi:hypothetical protein
MTKKVEKAPEGLRATAAASLPGLLIFLTTMEQNTHSGAARNGLARSRLKG